MDKIGIMYMKNITQTERQRSLCLCLSPPLSIKSGSGGQALEGFDAILIWNTFKFGYNKI